jgi:hypothetical protein
MKLIPYRTREKALLACLIKKLVDVKNLNPRRDFDFPQCLPQWISIENKIAAEVELNGFHLVLFVA